jgi:hypothetical protein
MFGIFDGHGGKQAATYTSKNLHAQVLLGGQGRMLPAGGLPAGGCLPPPPQLQRCRARATHRALGSP